MPATLTQLLNDSTVPVVLVCMGLSQAATAAAAFAGQVIGGQGGAWAVWHYREMSRLNEDWADEWGWTDANPPAGVFLLSNGDDYERSVADVQLTRQEVLGLTQEAGRALLRQRFTAAYAEFEAA